MLPRQVIFKSLTNEILLEYENGHEVLDTGGEGNRIDSALTLMKFHAFE